MCKLLTESNDVFLRKNDGVHRIGCWKKHRQVRAQNDQAAENRRIKRQSIAHKANDRHKHGTNNHVVGKVRYDGRDQHDEENH